MEGLSPTTFHCRKCNETKVIYSRGAVITGPWCPTCHKPMKQVVIVQTDLGLK